LIVQLSEILQFLSYHAKNDCIPIREEIIFTKKYIALLEARFGEKLKIEWRENLRDDSFNMPVLILQPIIENCIRHAWSEDKDQLSMHISLIQNQQSIQVTVEDDGRGIHPQRLNKIPIAGHALANISDRLSMCYHNQNLLTVSSVLNKGTKVNIEIPENCLDDSNPDRR
jgi:sensor histidine kinase YesM